MSAKCLYLECDTFGIGIRRKKLNKYMIKKTARNREA